MKVYEVTIEFCNGQFHQEGREVLHVYAGTYSSPELAEGAAKRLQTCNRCGETVGNPYYFPKCESSISELVVDEEPSDLAERIAIWNKAHPE